MNLENRTVLFLMKGGSHSYGLSTPTSDLDFRGVFVNTDMSHLVGLKRDEVLTEQNKEHDKVMTEFRYALKLLRGANTQMVEMLYSEEFEVLTQQWVQVQEARKQLVDSEKLFSCLRGYMSGELLLANGTRTGKLGGKRKEAIDKYGFSPKNFVQLFRLARAGWTYFQKGYFPVNIMKDQPEFGKELLTIKTQPEKFSKDILNDLAHTMEQQLVDAYENRQFNTTFDECVANRLCLNVYAPLVAALH